MNGITEFLEQTLDVLLAYDRHAVAALDAPRSSSAAQPATASLPILEEVIVGVSEILIDEKMFIIQDGKYSIRAFITDERKVFAPIQREYPNLHSSMKLRGCLIRLVKYSFHLQRVMIPPCSYEQPSLVLCIQVENMELVNLAGIDFPLLPTIMEAPCVQRAMQRNSWKRIQYIVEKNQNRSRLHNLSKKTSTANHQIETPIQSMDNGETNLQEIYAASRVVPLNQRDFEVENRTDSQLISEDSSQPKQIGTKDSESQSREDAGVKKNKDNEESSMSSEAFHYQEQNLMESLVDCDDEEDENDEHEYENENETQNGKDQQDEQGKHRHTETADEEQVFTQEISENQNQNGDKIGDLASGNLPEVESSCSRSRSDVKKSCTQVESQRNNSILEESHGYDTQPMTQEKWAQSVDSDHLSNKASPRREKTVGSSSSPPAANNSCRDSSPIETQKSSHDDVRSEGGELRNEDESTQRTRKAQKECVRKRNKSDCTQGSASENDGKGKFTTESETSALGHTEVPVVDLAAQDVEYPAPKIKLEINVNYHETHEIVSEEPQILCTNVDSDQKQTVDGGKKTKKIPEVQSYADTLSSSLREDLDNFFEYVKTVPKAPTAEKAQKVKQEDNTEEEHESPWTFRAENVSTSAVQDEETRYSHGVEHLNDQPNTLKEKQVVVFNPREKRLPLKAHFRSLESKYSKSPSKHRRNTLHDDEVEQIDDDSQCTQAYERDDIKNNGVCTPLRVFNTRSPITVNKKKKRSTPEDPKNNQQQTQYFIMRPTRRPKRKLVDENSERIRDQRAHSNTSTDKNHSDENHSEENRNGVSVVGEKQGFSSCRSKEDTGRVRKRNRLSVDNVLRKTRNKLEELDTFMRWIDEQ